MRREYLQVLLLVTAVVVAAPASAGRLYVADFDQSLWSSKRQEDICRLEHDVPMFGRAVLSQTPDGTLSLNVYALRPPLTDGAAELFSRNPAWKPASEIRLEAARMYSDGALLRFSDHTTRRILSELEAGQLAVVRFTEWPGAETEVELAISPVGFREGYRHHLACVGELPPTVPRSEDLLAQMGYAPRPSPTVLAPESPRASPPPVFRELHDPVM